MFLRVIFKGHYYYRAPEGFGFCLFSAFCLFMQHSDWPMRHVKKNAFHGEGLKSHFFLKYSDCNDSAKLNGFYAKLCMVK